MINIFRWIIKDKQSKPMNQPGIPLAQLVVKDLKKEITPAEKMQLEEWASLSTDNRLWLDRFYNSDWLSSRIEIMQSCNTEASRVKLKRRIEEIKKRKAR